MKIQSIVQKTTAAVLVAVGATATSGQISLGQSETAQFYCGVSDGVPTTMVKSPSLGEAPLIRWESNSFGVPPQERCEVVSANFQKFYSEGTLDYVTSGEEKGYPVVCVANTLGGSCDGRILFTLPKGTDPNQAIAQIFSLAGPLRNVDFKRTQNGQLYIKLENFLTKRKGQ